MSLWEPLWRVSQALTRDFDPRVVDAVAGRLGTFGVGFWLPDDLLLKADKMTMANSLELRVPFLDHKVVETIVRQPINQKVRGMTEKFVLREAVKDVITDTVYRRQKHPFLSPPATLSPEDTFNAYVQDTLRGPVLKALPFFDQKKVVALLDELPGMDTGARTANDQILMLLVSMCALEARYGLTA